MDLKKIIKKVFRFDNSPIQKKYRNYKDRKRRNSKKKLMDSVGEEMLIKLFETAKECNISIWLEFGTLLGAYRNNNFISYDLDIDTGMYACDYSLRFEDELLDKGFKKRRSFYQRNVATDDYFLTEVTFDYSGFSVDIFLSFKNKDDNRSVYVYGFESKEFSQKNMYNVRKYDFPLVDNLEKVRIRGTEFNSPNNPENTLKIIYGDNFMIPDPSWDTTKSRLNVSVFSIEERYANKKGYW